jgi:hypothetical protein
MIRPIWAFAIVISAAVLIPSAVVIGEFAFAVPGAKAGSSSSASIPLFRFERQARLHCPDDALVWTTAGSGIYSSSADRWYGRTKSGAYGCLHDAANAGYRVER